MGDTALNGLEDASNTGRNSEGIDAQDLDWRTGQRVSTGPWDDFTLVGPDPKGKYRRVKPGVCLLAHGIPARVAKLRALGNAISPPLAAQFVRAWLDSQP